MPNKARYTMMPQVEGGGEGGGEGRGRGKGEREGEEGRGEGGRFGCVAAKVC